ncbi:MAG: aldo/keto reductase [Hyphomonadaceae bacterium]|nr:aldo/keto reductase [Hyphomonadaceae bacterium]
MEKRVLGMNGPEISVLSFGLMTFSEGDSAFAAIGDTHGQGAERQVAIALEAGVNLFDTSDNYSGGQSEMILAHALGKRRKDVLIATKAFGRTGPGEHDIGLSRTHLIAACEASLKRLNTDRIDLYQVHNFDSLTPLEETLRALDDLVRTGKVRFIGCSNHFAWQTVKALGLSERLSLAPYISQQVQYSLLVRDVEEEILPAGVDAGLGALIYSPLAQGYLTGKFSRGEAEGARLIDRDHLRIFDTEQARRILETVQTIAAAHQATPGQIALRWVMQRRGVTSVIFGARTEAQLRDNLGAAAIDLSQAEMTELERISQPARRYPRLAQDVFHPERNPPLFPRPASKP